MKLNTVLFALLGLGLLRGQPQFKSTRLAVDPTPLEVKAGDFNKDGIQDLAVLSTGSIQILLGKGDGTFQAPVKTAVGTYLDIAVADFNHDGKSDIVAIFGGYQQVLGHSTTPIDVFIGHGDGTFAAPVSYAVPPLFTDYATIQVGDVNGDGNPDLVTQDFVLLGNRDGTFGAGTFTQLINSAPGATVGAYTSETYSLADFNGDGKTDILFPKSHTNPTVDLPVSVALGQASGNFGTPNRLASSTGLFPDVAAGDFDGDGKMDALILDGGGGGIFAVAYAFLVYRGDGKGNFPTHTYSAADQIRIGATGDINGDGKADLAVFSSTGVRVYLSNGDGTFSASADIPVGTTPSRLTLADLNGDGLLDVIVVNGGSNDLSILMNTAVRPGISSTANAASFAKDQASPGALLTLFGNNLSASATPAQSFDNPLPVSLGGVSVSINGVDARLEYVSQTQINLQVPWTVSGVASVVVKVNGTPLPAYSLTISTAAPGVYAIGAQAIGINLDGTLAGPGTPVAGLPSRPAAAGDTIIILANGLGAVTPSIANGVPSSDALRNAVNMPQVLIGGVQAFVAFAGLSPQYVGVNQLNVVIPAGVSGTVPLQISSGGIKSTDQVTIGVKP